MEEEIKDKIRCLVRDARVMTLAVSEKDVPWSAPVYFVCHAQGFYFFSNERSRHIRCAEDHRQISASIFHDADRMDHIFGLQMSGRVERVSKKGVSLAIVKKYVSKFNFLEQVFGSGVMENRDFFLETFKSRLYCFCPDTVFLSDNSRPGDKRSRIDLRHII